MKKIDNFIKYYSVSKTLRFSLLPVGSTEENFNNKLLLEEDKERAVGYDKVKSYIDDCHRQHIESVLSKVSVDNIDKYAELYYKSDKSNKEIENMKKAEAEMRETIANNLKKNQTYKALFSKDVIQEASIGLNKDEIALLNKFDNFTTYFLINPFKFYYCRIFGLVGSFFRLINPLLFCSLFSDTDKKRSPRVWSRTAF